MLENEALDRPVDAGQGYVRLMCTARRREGPPGLCSRHVRVRVGRGPGDAVHPTFCGLSCG